MRYFILCLLFFGFGEGLSAQQTTTPPRLVVGIVVDGLQQKHIDILWNYFNPGGFKKIIGKGANCPEVRYNIVSAGNASDIANIMTGTTPYYNGIAGNNYYGRKEYEMKSILYDANQSGIGTKESYSAHNLLCSNLMDELVLAYPNKTKCYAVGINAEDAIMMGGHTAKGVAWIDDVAQKWVGTAYYTNGLPAQADKMNENGDFKNYVNRNWTPMYAINTYLNAPDKEDKKTGFLYYPSSRKNKNFPNTLIKNTPWANSLVADLGIRIMEEEQLGSSSTTDMIMLQFTVKTPNERNSTLQSAEKEDIYLRLDKDIETLVHKIETKLGVDKSLIFMVANQTDQYSPTQLGDHKIPSGYFNAHRSISLLSNYLVAVYGQERWIDGYYGKNIYLNKQRIEAKKVNFRDMQQTVVNFMLEFEGIQSAYTSTQLFNITGNGNSEMLKLQNSTNKKNAGDVIITLLPGWLEVDDKNNPIGESNALTTYTPLYIYGGQIVTKRITNNYQTIDIAPTLARILNIATPNACMGRPMEELFSK
jgi:hypothetical protein